MPEKKRMQHPQAKLIPGAVWSEIFRYEIANFELKLMSMPPHELRAKLIEMKDNLCDEEKLKSLFCCAYKEPVLNDAFLHEMCDAIQLPSYVRVALWAVTGRIGFLIEIFNSEREKYIDDLAFKLTAGVGHLDVMNELMRLAPTRVQEMIAANQFGAFVAAAEGGHLDVMRELMRLAPTRVQEMIAAKGFIAFGAAADDGHLDVMNELMRLAPECAQ